MRSELAIPDAAAGLRSFPRQGSADRQERYVEGRSRSAFVLLLGLVAVVGSVSLTWGIGRWPWDIDEVWTLRELGLLDSGSPLLTNAATQSARLPRLVPLWYACQGMVLRHLPITEGSARLLPVLCAILGVIAAYVWAARCYNLSFAVCLALFMIGNPLFLAQAQQNRFYSMAILFLVLANMTLFSTAEKTRKAPVLLAGAFAVLAVLSHSLLVVYFVLAAAAALAATRFSGGAVVPLRRFLAAALACLLLYFFYIRPLAQGWNSHGRPSMASALMSAVSEATIPLLALAGLGGVAAFVQKQNASFRVWAILAGLTALAVTALPAVIWFNAQYTLLFLLPFWVLAAHAVSEIGARLGRGPLAWSWYVAVVLLLLPRVASYYQDGSRKDLRAAGDLVSRNWVAGETIYCNLPQVLQYYLPEKPVKEWNSTEDLPKGVSYVVQASNGWEPPLRINGKIVETLARIGKRRFDEQAYIVSIYRISSP